MGQALVRVTGGRGAGRRASGRATRRRTRERRRGRRWWRRRPARAEGGRSGTRGGACRCRGASGRGAREDGRGGGTWRFSYETPPGRGALHRVHGRPAGGGDGGSKVFLREKTAGIR